MLDFDQDGKLSLRDIINTFGQIYLFLRDIDYQKEMYKIKNDLY